MIGYLAAIDIHRPRYLVANQPIPYVLSTTIDNHRKLDIDSYLIPAVQNESTLLIFGGGFVNDRIDMTGINVTVKGLYGSFFGTGNLGRNGFWITYQSVGWFGNEIDVGNNSSPKYFQISQIGLKWNSRLSVRGGILYGSNFGRPVMLPLLGIAYSKDNWILDVTLPFLTEFRYIFRKYLHVVVSGKMNTQSYAINNRNDILDYSDIKVCAGFEFMIWKWIWATAGINHYGYRSAILDNTPTVRKLTGIRSFAVGLILRVE